MITSKLVDTFAYKVQATFSKPENQRKLNTIVSRYVDKNVAKLTTVGPSKRPMFLDSDRNLIYDMVGVQANSIVAVVRDTDYIKEGTNPGDPFNIIMTLTIRYFKMKKLTKEMNAAILYLTLSMYPSLHAKYFRYEPNEQIMAYTIQHMSNKYKVKQMGTVMAALFDTTRVSDEHYAKELIRGNDKDIADYILSFKTRLNGFMKNVCAEFMKQHSAKNYLNYEVDNEDEENYSVADSNSYVITRVADASVLKLSVQGPNAIIVKSSAKLNDVSVNSLRTTLTAICRDKNSKKEMHELVSNILYLFLFDGSHTKEEINSSRFLLFSMDIYKKANTTDKNIVRIKAILDNWIAAYSGQYKKSNAVGTINAFRKALYTFFVLSIQKNKV